MWVSLDSSCSGLCASCTWMFASFSKLRKFLVIISSSALSVPLSLCSPSGTPIMLTLVLLLLSQRSLKASAFKKHFLPLLFWLDDFHYFVFQIAYPFFGHLICCWLLSSASIGSFLCSLSLCWSCHKVPPFFSQASSWSFLWTLLLSKVLISVLLGFFLWGFILPFVWNIVLWALILLDIWCSSQWMRWNSSPSQCQRSGLLWECPCVTYSSWRLWQVTFSWSGRWLGVVLGMAVPRASYQDDWSWSRRGAGGSRWRTKQWSCQPPGPQRRLQQFPTHLAEALRLVNRFPSYIVQMPFKLLFFPCVPG